MPAKVFFDTSIILYIVSKDDWRAPIATDLLSGGGIISVQVLNEFVNVMRRKFRRDWDLVDEDVFDIRTLCNSILPVTLKTHEAGLRIARRYGFHIYDSLIVAAALEAGCSTLYSEDMQNGQIIESLTIRNPFANH